MGGGGFLGLGPAPSAPAAPDYTGVAQATAQGNLEAARAATAANRVNQVTPYGNLTYTQNQQSTFNSDAYNNAMNAYNQAMQNYSSGASNPQYSGVNEDGSRYQALGDQPLNGTSGNAPTMPNYSDFVTNSNPDGGWVATTTLSPEQQQILNMQNQASLGLGSTINAQLGQVQNVMNQGFNPNLPSTGMNPGQSYQDAYMQRLAPQIAQSRESTTAALANQGIVPGTQAYDNAMRQQAMKENDLLLGATTQGFGVGSQANQQAFNQALTKYNLPLNTLSALRTGAQVQNPSFVNTPQQATTSGADLLGASQMGYNAQMGNFNAGQAAQSNFNQGLMGLGQAGLMALI